MFYSHQLLARKAPLGQIWMAATLHAKINRRKLDKLNIIKICEEILNPTVPMALRLSGILMGGVVIVYERKVKLLYDDVHRLLVEINEAWKVKGRADPTVLPKGKTQAKYEAVTLREDPSGEMETEQPLRYSSTAAGAPTSGFQSFMPMGLDQVSDAYIKVDPGEEGPTENHHQADPANITLLDDYGSGTLETEPFNRFERFDIEGDDNGYFNITPEVYPKVPTTLVPSPPQEEPLQDEIKYQGQEEQDDQQPNGFRNMPKEADFDVLRQRKIKRKARPMTAHVIMDNELTIIPGNIYQSWLHDTSDIVSRQGRRNKPRNPILPMKISNLMELPPVALISGFDKITGEVYYPKPLLELWRKSIQPQTANDSSSGRISPTQQPEHSSPAPPERVHLQDPPEFPTEDFQSGIGSQELPPSIEKLRNNLGNVEQQALEEALKRHQFVTPGSSGPTERSIPSSGSGHSFPQMDVEIQLHSGRSKRRQHSSSRNSLGGLDPVEEEIPWEHNGRIPKLRRLSEYGPTPDLELLEETVPTQTPIPISEPSMNEIARSISTHLKLHFDTPGAPQVESLNQLASGMNRRKAAQLFYQTCVLATADFLKVEQTVAYGDIYISRGPKM